MGETRGFYYPASLRVSREKRYCSPGIESFGSVDRGGESRSTRGRERR